MRKLDKWDFMYSLAEEYYKENGNLLIKNNYTVYNNGIQYSLGIWIANQRNNYKKNELSNERINLLNEIGMVWDVYDVKWDFMYSLAEEYYKENGDLLIPENYIVTKNNKTYDLWCWLYYQKAQYRAGNLEQKRIDLLNKIHVIWSAREAYWEFMYGLAKEFYQKYNDLLIPQTYTVVKDGIEYNLGMWLSSQRKKFKKNVLEEEKIELLNQIGIVWECSKSIYSKRGYKKDRKKTDAACVYNKEYNLTHILYSDKYDESIKTFIKWINNFTMPKKQEMDELLKQVQNGNISAKQIIANSYLKYVVNAVSHYFPCEKDFIDYVQDANIYILKQIDLHAYSEKFHQCVSVNLLKHLKHIKQTQKEKYTLIPNECILYLEEKELEFEKKRSEKEFFKNIKHILTEVEYEIICNTFNYENFLSTEKILETYNICLERKRQLKNKALEKIKHYLENYDKLPYYNFNARDFYALFSEYSKSDINVAKNTLSPKSRSILYQVHGKKLNKSLANYFFKSNLEYYRYKSSILEIQNILMNNEREKLKNAEMNNKFVVNYVDSEYVCGYSKTKK